MDYEGPQGMFQGFNKNESVNAFAMENEDTMKERWLKQRQQEAANRETHDVGINTYSEIIASAQMTVPQLNPKEVARYTELLAAGIMENIKKRIPKAIKVHPNEDGTFDVRVQFVIIKLDEANLLIGNLGERK